MTHLKRLPAILLVVFAAVAVLPAQQGTLTPAETERRHTLERELQDLAVVERRVMMPMRDGVRLATDIYRPKAATGPVPVVFVKTPYNFNFWDVRNGVPADMTTIIAAVKRGYAYVVQNERGHFFSEGNYDILGPPHDRRLRCHRLADQAALVQRQGRDHRLQLHRRVAAGRGLARPSGVRRDERPGLRRRRRQGRSVLGTGQLVSRRRDADALHRPGSTASRTRCARCSRATRRRQDLIAASRLFDLAPRMPPVDWSQALWHLPVQDIMKHANGPRGVFADAMPVATGGRMIQREPAVAGVDARRPLARDHAARRARPLVHVLVRRLGRPEPRDVQPRAPDREGLRATSSGPSSRRWRTARSPAPRRTPWSASGAWATRGSTTTRSSTGSSTASSRARRARAWTRCRRSPISRWAATGGRRPRRGRRRKPRR